MRREHPRWGARRISYELASHGLDQVPSRATVHRVLTRNGLIDPQAQQHKRKYKRWQRQAPMHLWQLDIVGGVPQYAETHKAASIQRCWSTWNVLCTFLYPSELIPANPMPLVGRLKIAKTLSKALPPSSVQALLAAIASESERRASDWRGRDRALILTSLLAGLRADELLRANIGDVRRSDPGAVIHVRGKGGKDRHIPVEPAFVDVLENYLDDRAVRFPITAKRRSSPESGLAAWPPTAPLFVGSDGDRITRGTLQYRVLRAFRRTGIDGDRARGALVHGLRHTFATELNGSTGPLDAGTGVIEGGGQQPQRRGQSRTEVIHEQRAPLDAPEREHQPGAEHRKPRCAVGTCGGGSGPRGCDGPPDRSTVWVPRGIGSASGASVVDDCVVRFWAELEPATGDLQGVHPHIAKLLRRRPRPQVRPLGFADFGAGRQHMRPALDDDAPPVGEFGVVVVGLERHEGVRRCAEELGALGSSEQHRRALGDEVDREDFGPPVQTGDEPA